VKNGCQIQVMKIGIVTLFPGMFTALSEYGITGRAVRNKLLQLNYWNPRDYASDRHRSVDDRPYGGGPGMVMRAEPVSLAITAAKSAISANENHAAWVVYLSPQGKPLDQQHVAKLVQRQNLVLMCGRYEGVDERVLSSQIDEECSLGDFVLSGGELAAMALLDAMIRLLPGALGDADSALQDSFSNYGEDDLTNTNLLDHPHYTRPEIFAGMNVPPVLLSGDHAQIELWRLQQRLGITWQKRPDLVDKMQLTAQQKQLLDAFKRVNTQTGKIDKE
jgi:tRNA (guanine37-N1)-methyltransferase